jgi:hypothetical protein
MKLPAVAIAAALSSGICLAGGVLFKNHKFTHIYRSGIAVPVGHCIKSDPRHTHPGAPELLLWA